LAVWYQTKEMFDRVRDIFVDASWKCYAITIKSHTRYTLSRSLIVRLMQKGQRAEQDSLWAVFEEHKQKNLKNIILTLLMHHQ